MSLRRIKDNNMAPTTLHRPKARRDSLALKATVNPDEPLFGQHWTLDGYGADSSALNSMDLVFTVLNDLPTALSMQKIMTPYVVRFDGNDKKDAGGYSGFVMIAESHISIHTFPAKGFITVDVYTCQGELDVPACRNFFAQAFGVQEFEENLINRGRKYGTV